MKALEFLVILGTVLPLKTTNYNLMSMNLLSIKNICSLLGVILIGLSSCTMVKNPKSSSFHRVKYNSHVKLANNSKLSSIDQTVSNFEVGSDQASRSTSRTNREDIVPIQKRSFIINGKQFSGQIREKSVFNSPVVVSSEKQMIDAARGESILWNPIQGLINAKPKVTLLSPAAELDEGLGDLLYIILVVLLVLIILSFIADLAGGLVGTLIAILLILLILHWLGYV